VTNHTITDSGAFLLEMAQTRERGYAINRHESSTRVISFGAPSMRFDGKPIAAVAASTDGQQSFLDQGLLILRWILDSNMTLISPPLFLSLMKWISLAVGSAWWETRAHNPHLLSATPAPGR
jgi:hypothetical protein